MDNNQFERQVQQKLQGFSANPPEQVWQGINSRLNAKKKKRRLIFWFLPLSMLSLVISNRFMTNNIKQSDVILPLVKEIKPEQKNQYPAIFQEHSEKHETAALELNGFKNQIINHTKPLSLVNAPKDSGKDFNQINAIDASPLQLQTEMMATVLQEDYNKIIYSPTHDWVEPLSLRNIAQLKKSVFSPHPEQDTIIVTPCFPQQTKTGKTITWHYSAAYSFHGTGDLEGMQLEWGFSRPINRHFSFYNNFGVSLHGGSVVQPLNLNILVGPSATQPVGQGSIYEITSAIQTAPTLLGSVPGTPLRIGVGGLLRYQFYSGGSGYGVQRNQNMQTFTLSDGNFNGVSVGYRVLVGLELLNTKRNKLQFQAGFQNDTRGDVITGLGLSWQHLKK
jgi:hypothetical protein